MAAPNLASYMDLLGGVGHEQKSCGDAAVVALWLQFHGVFTPFVFWCLKAMLLK